MDEILTFTQAGVSGLCWVVVAAGSMIAIFSPRIQDTLLERIGLCMVSCMAIAAAWRALAHGWVTNIGFLVSIALAFYVFAVFFKHCRVCHIKPLRKKA